MYQAMHSAQTARLGAPSMAARAARCGARRAALLPPPPGRCARRTIVEVSAKKGMSEADLYIAADGGAAPPATSLPARTLPPWYVLAPAALAGAVLVLRIIKAISRRL